MVRPTKKSGPRIRGRVLLYLGVFLVFTLGVLWLTQTVFLDSLYKTVRVRRSQEAVERIGEMIQSGSVEDDLREIAELEQICVSVFAIENGKAVPYLTAHAIKFCLIHNGMSEDQLDSLLSESASGKIYQKEVTPAGDPGKENGFFHPDDSRSSILICAKLVSSDGFDYLIVTNSMITPAASTTDALRLLLLFVSLLMLGGGVLLGFLISGSISRPIEKMSREAAKLADGDEEVRFEGGNIRELSELAETLNYAAGEMSSVSRMQKELLANISHDLRTPLTMISGYSEVMRDIPEERTPENMQIVIDETERLTSLVNDTLEMSRLTEGKQELSLSDFSLTQVLKETAERYSRLYMRQGLSVHFEADADYTVRADKTRILQVVYNMINNGLSYTGEDGKVILRLAENGGKVRVSVTDSGPGIPEDQLPNVWDRYYKLSEYHRRGVSGSGLGLSICKSILLLHRADFGVSSRVGKGSTFWFELPFTAKGDN
ncbi:MAG: HAMP domain-containing histidine kinase [Clostridia bacterium]|nr:HAMP domain-containing histidine kinase [Clostridia bacterium]